MSFSRSTLALSVSTVLAAVGCAAEVDAPGEEPAPEPGVDLTAEVLPGEVDDELALGSADLSGLNQRLLGTWRITLERDQRRNGDPTLLVFMYDTRSGLKSYRRRVFVCEGGTCRVSALDSGTWKTTSRIDIDGRPHHYLVLRKPDGTLAQRYEFTLGDDGVLHVATSFRFRVVRLARAAMPWCRAPEHCGLQGYNDITCSSFTNDVSDDIGWSCLSSRCSCEFIGPRL